MKYTFWFFLTFIFLTLMAYPFADSKVSILPGTIRIYAEADSAYSAKNFSLASLHYGRILDDASYKISPSTHFKYAYSLHRDQQFYKSNLNFKQLAENHNAYLPEFVDYFKVKNLWRLNKAHAAAYSEKFIIKYSKSALADSLMLPVANYYFETNSFKKARNYYLQFKKKKIDKSRIAYATIRAAICFYNAGNKSLAKDEFIQILRKYPVKEETFGFTQWLAENESTLYKKHFFKIVDVYYNNGQYAALRELLEEYIKSENDSAVKDKARYNLIKLYFANGQNNTALYGFQNMLEQLKNKNLEPHIMIYIARIYLRKGLKQKAIDTYVDYAKKFPRRRLAPEAMWKAAWVSEELKDLPQAQEYYRLVRKKWPRSHYARSAYFREGFTYFRLGQLNYADNVFNEIRYKRWPDIDRNRAKFWAALCREMQNDTLTAIRLRQELAENLWDDYYTMKSYLMHKEMFDSSLHILQKFENSSKQLTYYGNGFASLLPHFEQAFEVKDVLNEKYAFGVLEDIKLVAQTLDEWIALAEIYKKLQAYGHAYKTYDYIDRKFFADVAFIDKAFILKERFPFYYDGFVSQNATKNNVEPELVLALMKQESVFDFKAHSWADAYGLMQLIPSTAREMASLVKVPLTENNQLFDPEFNIKLGTRYMRQLFRQFDKKEFVLAAYNAGPHRVKRWEKLPGSENTDVFIENVEFYQTRNYVRKVMKNYWAYKLLQNNFNVNSRLLYLGML